jgi:hypothetical protein
VKWPTPWDTLAYAKRLREAGVPSAQAEVQAEASREFVTAELVTRTDAETAQRELEGAIKRQTLRLTIRLRGMVAIAVAVLATISAFHRSPAASALPGAFSLSETSARHGRGLSAPTL